MCSKLNHTSLFCWTKANSNHPAYLSKCLLKHQQCLPQCLSVSMLRSMLVCPSVSRALTALLQNFISLSLSLYTHTHIQCFQNHNLSCSLSLSLSIYLYLSLSLHLYIHTYIYIYTHTHTNTHTHTHISNTNHTSLCSWTKAHHRAKCTNAWVVELNAQTMHRSAAKLNAQTPRELNAWVVELNAQTPRELNAQTLEGSTSVWGLKPLV